MEETVPSGKLNMSQLMILYVFVNECFLVEGLQIDNNCIFGLFEDSKNLSQNQQPFSPNFIKSERSSWSLSSIIFMKIFPT